MTRTLLSPLAALLFSLAACDGSDGITYPYTYEAPCFTVHSEVELDSAHIAASSLIASKLVDQFFGVPDTFCSTMRGHPVYVHLGYWDSHSKVPCEGEGHCVGTYQQLDGSVHLDDSGQPLVHEFLHVYDANRFSIGSNWHEHWDTNGYDALDKAFYILTGNGPVVGNVHWTVHAP